MTGLAFCGVAMLRLMNVVAIRETTAVDDTTPRETVIELTRSARVQVVSRQPASSLPVRAPLRRPNRRLPCRAMAASATCHAGLPG